MKLFSFFGKMMKDRNIWLSDSKVVPIHVALRVI